MLQGTTFICTLTFSSPQLTTLSSPTFSVRPRSSVSRVTVDLIRRSWVRFLTSSKIFSLPCVVPWFPLLGLTPSALFMGSISTLIYTSELTLCSIICVHSAARHNIHIPPYFLFAAIHPPKIVPDFLCPPSQSNSRSSSEVVGSIPTEVKRFFLYLVWLPDSLY